MDSSFTSNTNTAYIFVEYREYILDAVYGGDRKCQNRKSNIYSLVFYLK